MKTYAEQVGCGPTIERYGAQVCCNLAREQIIAKVLDETLPALDKYQRNPSRENLVDLASGIVDSVTVLLHAANSLDIPFDAIWNEVYRSRVVEIREVTREIKPDIFGVVMEYQTQVEMGEHYMKTGMVK